ncbi:MAG: hypothetical protein HC902_10930 [Calothrix sp. SM1_5_4]|nr:hypothetical protein [Calothrix sp. SM1_5_4]
MHYYAMYFLFALTLAGPTTFAQHSSRWTEPSHPAVLCEFHLKNKKDVESGYSIRDGDLWINPETRTLKYRGETRHPKPKSL